jgi:hypothetical protein
MEVFSNFTRDTVKRTCNWFWLRLEDVVAAEYDFICRISSLYCNK